MLSRLDIQHTPDTESSEDKNDSERKPELLIKVPNYKYDTPKYTRERDDMEIDGSSPSSLNFEHITQLPTPIINSGSFGSFNSVGSPQSPPLEISKIRNKPMISKFNNRAISEYRPIDGKVIQPIYEKRITSNPLVGDIVEDDDMATDEISKYSSSVFSSKFGNFKFIKLLGTGNFSTVVMVEGPAKAKMAVKIISIPLKRKSEIRNHKYFIKRELNILYQVEHPSIVKLLDYSINLSIPKGEIEHGIVESESELEDNDEKDISADVEALSIDNNQLIYLNYCKGGNLFEFSSTNYKKYNRLPQYWKVINQFVIELIDAVRYLHENYIIHRDIKLENVLLNHTIEELLISDVQPKNLSPLICLTDFGLAKKLHRSHQLLSTRCGSTDYIAPEILMGLKYNGKLTDSWSVGVLIYCLIEDRLPFDLPNYSYLMNSGISPSVIKRKMSKNTPAHRIAMIDWDWYVINDLQEKLDDTSLTIVNNLKKIVQLLIVRKDNRITMEQLVERQEFRDIVNM
ncbi:serine/threonine-protein kinase Prr1p [[Candida] jaroonii]|uniref:Serine/threonine-protein kinase Prr1p n=1 Tax=[Candida] jaroonii TaxID=467808 RepID=A0ACA9Y2L6_9ASCO|nr:serine/threonine-protein kinase Prr1p [[Candida] jaroonii]